MSKIMLDLETMGTASDSAIVAIGAVKFDDVKITGRFHKTIDLQSSIRLGLKVDGGATMFWLRQSDEARQSITGGEQLQLRDALIAFTDWAGDISEIWGNGANFDEPILTSSFVACNFLPPWKFWNSRCHRTMVRTFPEIHKPPFKGTVHNALDDAENQALHLLEILKHLRGMRT